MVPVNTMHGADVPVEDDPDGKARYAKHVVRNWSYLVVGYLATILIAGVTVPFFAPATAWFGMIYLIPSALCVAALGLVASGRLGPTSRTRAFLWFLTEASLGVGITTLYSATIVPLYSGTQVSQLVGIQLGHSVACFVAALLVAVVWQSAERVKDRRKR